MAHCEISSWDQLACGVPVVVTIMPLWLSFHENEHWINGSCWTSMLSVARASHITVSVASTMVQILLSFTQKSPPGYAVTMALYKSGCIAPPASLEQTDGEKSSWYWTPKHDLAYILGAWLTSTCCAVEDFTIHFLIFHCSANIYLATSCPQPSLVSMYHINIRISLLFLTISHSKVTEKQS